ncbi:MAG: type IV secretory system conjugative DNA transfer family protein [Pseudomonadota bacterium]|nr:type IV secretory system conjugative DNA transfer family protein [Pseudomonadota bacterium]
MRSFRILLTPILLLIYGCSGGSSAVDQEFKAQARQEVVKTAAITYATKYALYWESVSINNHMDTVSRQLDNTFNFREILLKNEVIPPILQESTDNVSMENSKTIRVSDRMIKIIKPARFSSAIPTWRNYLHMNFKKPDLPQDKMLPQNPEEREVWDKGLTEGWTIGRWQARSIFAANIGMMQRDMMGMILYHKLLTQGMISPTYSSIANLGITGNGKSMYLNDRLVRITSESELRPHQSSTWRPAIRPTKD